MRGLEPALILLAVALAAHGAWRLSAGDAADRFSAGFDLALATAAACAVLFWRAEGKDAEPEPRDARSNAPLADFLTYALPAILFGAAFWLLTRG